MITQPDADHYALLGVSPGASPEEIRRAYLRAIRAVHPDVAPGRDDEARAINHAYRTLMLAARNGAFRPDPPTPPPPPTGPVHRPTASHESAPPLRRRPTAAERFSVWGAVLVVVGIALWAGSTVDRAPATTGSDLAPLPFATVGDCELFLAARFGQALEAHLRTVESVDLGIAAGAMSGSAARLDGALASAEARVRRIDRTLLTDDGSRVVSGFVALLEADRAMLALAVERRWDDAVAARAGVAGDAGALVALVQGAATAPLCQLSR